MLFYLLFILCLFAHLIDILFEIEHLIIQLCQFVKLFNCFLLSSEMNEKDKLEDQIRFKYKDSLNRKSNISQQKPYFSSSEIHDLNYSHVQPVRIEKNSKIRSSQAIDPKTNPVKKVSLNILTDEVKANINASRMGQFSSPANLELDPRDERILIPFESSYYALLEQSNFVISFQPFHDEIRDWLIDVIQIVTSISFNHLKKQTLSDVEVKAFAAKNILLNIKEIYEKYPKIPLEKRVELMTFVNESTQRIFQKIIHKYPQNSSRGASKRVKSRILTINNRQSDEFDFLLRNNIRISYREDGDYSEDIMKIINKLVSFTNEVFDPNDESQETNFEVFTEIMECIFENCNSQGVSSIAQEVTGIVNRKKNPDQNILSQLNGTFATQLVNWGESIRDEESKKNSSFIKDSHKTFLIGQKIPSGTRLFSDEDINGSIFKIHDSSILRLLTKWAQQLKGKLANAEDSIYRRLYKFKTSNSKLVNLELDLKVKLYQAAILEYKKIDEYFESLKAQNVYLQTLFAQELSVGKYCKNDIKIDLFAAKLNKISGHYIFRYINKMIHSLLTISKLASEQTDNEHDRLLLQSVSLVTFKIGDLMRSKCACSEQEFIKILLVLDELHSKAPDFLKIVRIKNRLEQQNNDVLINLFFMNKVECELQLSITGKSTNKNQKKSNHFQHFLYQIIRSEMGPISELAITLAQYDPLINLFCKEDTYNNDLLPQSMTAQKNKELCDKIQERIHIRQSLNLANNIELPFVCCVCQNLSVINNPHFYWRDPNSFKRQCNNCRLKSIKTMTGKNQKEQILTEHLINHNFTKEDQTIFFKFHLSFWDSDKFIKTSQDMPSDTVSTQWIPKKGYMVKVNQKTPKLQLFTSLYESVTQNVIFAHKIQNGQIRLLSKIPIHCDKKRKFQILKAAFKKYFIFSLKNVKQTVHDNSIYFKCERQNCCGLTVKAGLYLSTDEIVQRAHNVMIEHFIDNRISVLYLNQIPEAFDKLEKIAARIKDGPKLKTMRNTIEAIEAHSCSLTNINIVHTFNNLFQLNISNNPEVQSLKGLEDCLQLKFLNCKKCDISNLNELKKLFKLEYLNIGLNKNLKCLGGLAMHSQLLELYMENTGISCLRALSECPKLESLDIQDCAQVTSLEAVKSQRLTYLNIVNCSGLQCFNLPLPALKSLKSIELYRQSPQTVAYNLIFSNLKLLNKSQTNLAETIQEINSILKIQKTQSFQLMLNLQNDND